MFYASVFLVVREDLQMVYDDLLIQKIVNDNYNKYKSTKNTF